MKNDGATAKTNKAPRVKRGTTVTTAFLRLRDLIVQGQISPGAWILEAELAERLKLSRTPIRNALQWLQREGFILEHKVGTKSRMRVSPLTKEDASEIYMIVSHIESMAGSLTAALPEAERSELCVTLLDLNHRLNQIATSKKVEPRQVFDLDTTFHYKIVAASAGPRLLTFHQIVKPQVERYWRLYAHTIISDLHLSVSEHGQIIEGISKGNAKMVEHAIEHNWKKGAERISRLIEMFGERGSW